MRNSQLRYAIIYVIITALALCFLNIYAAKTSRDLVNRANESAVMNRAKVISASFKEIDSVTNEAVQRTLAELGMGPESYDRLVITDGAAVVVYDSIPGSAGNETGRTFLLASVVQALEKQDVFNSRFRDGVIECYATVPIMYRDVPVGAVYLMVCDAGQGALLKALEATVLRVSVILALAVIAFSVLFSAIYARRMRRVMDSVRKLREGDYSNENKLRIRSHDELERLATEFNLLADRLHESEQRRRQFVSDASHELKTPLASIKLLSDSILQNEMDTDTMREFVGDIGSEADRLTRLSQKLLELTKLDAMVEEERGIVDIQTVARRVFRMLKPQMESRSIRLEDETIPGCTVKIAEDDLYQILFNLVENGIKYNNDGGRLCLRLEKNENNVTIRVIDGGVGIPEEAIGLIFERFYRVDKARSRQAGGSGLGLSIVHDMVVRNFGTVRAENVPEGGACFTVVFPFAEKEEAE
ncbi:MAG: HAMP domain-containing histidine kinase [Oscillospiraceae bacterium]|nr:HAMP domain-containing histidine kinase [Oscillospiraceae bacterium]